MMIEEEAHWITVDVDEDRAKRLAASLSIALPVARVLVARGLQTPEAAERFINPRLSELSDPFEMPGMRVAVDRLWKAIDGGERITVYGDYDADGVTSTALLLHILGRFNAKTAAFIPKRLEDGYGFSIGALDKVIEATHPSLIVTADCGMRSTEAVMQAVQKGIDVIITDHHEGRDGELPAAVAVINPKCGGPPATSSLSGVGVAFKVCHALVKRAIADGREIAKAVDLRDYLDLVAIGTVADVVPLTGENRTLVRHGLSRLNSAVPRCGLQALIRVAGIRTKIDCYQLGFMMGPRLNAAGRLGSAEIGLELLMTDNKGRAKRLAGQLDASNRERKRIEEVIIEEAIADIEAEGTLEGRYGLVVYRRSWHVGTIGIVAARLAGRFRRPAVVIAVDETGLGRASCRSVDSVNLIKVLDRCADLLETYGGHVMAAGFSIQSANIVSFKERFNQVCAEQISTEDMGVTHIVDSWVTLEETDVKLIESVEALRPLGLGNPTPLWGVRKVRVLGPPRLVGGNHIKLVVVSGGTQVDAIGFGMAGRKIHPGELDMLFQVQLNTYMGRETIQLSIRDLKPSRCGDAGVEPSVASGRYTLS